MNTMKKGVINLLILALVLVNLVLSLVLVFTFIPSIKKTNTLVDKICKIIDLDVDGEWFDEPIEPTIIRCKDCRFYRNLGKNSYCTKRLNVDSVTDRYRAPDFYCADAELREVKK